MIYTTKWYLEEIRDGRYFSSCGGLERYTTGLRPRTITLFAYRPCMGKTKTLFRIMRECDYSNIWYFFCDINEYDMADYIKNHLPKKQLENEHADIFLKNISYMTCQQFVDCLNEEIKNATPCEVILIDDIDRLYDYDQSCSYLYKELKKIASELDVTIAVTTTMKLKYTEGNMVETYKLEDISHYWDISRYLDTCVYFETIEDKNVCLGVFNTYSCFESEQKRRFSLRLVRNARDDEKMFIERNVEEIYGK